MHASCAAYENDPTTYSFFHDFHFDEVIPFSSDPKKDGGATRGFLAARNDAIILAFRGSDDAQDWAINFNVKKIQDNGAHVHEGFVLALASVWDKISTPLRKMVEQKNRKIWVTGHSLGGALATLATRRLLNMGVGQIETHTFGQPRVGGIKLAKQITSTFYRFAYVSDPVPVFPPERMRYVHTGTLKQIGADGTIRGDSTSLISQIAAQSNTIKQFFGNSLKTFIRERIDDHFISNYVEKIAIGVNKR